MKQSTGSRRQRTTSWGRVALTIGLIALAFVADWQAGAKRARLIDDLADARWGSSADDCSSPEGRALSDGVAVLPIVLSLMPDGWAVPDDAEPVRMAIASIGVRDGILKRRSRPLILFC